MSLLGGGGGGVSGTQKRTNELRYRIIEITQIQSSGSTPPLDRPGFVLTPSCQLVVYLKVLRAWGLSELLLVACFKAQPHLLVDGLSIQMLCVFSLDLFALLDASIKTSKTSAHLS